MLSKMIKVRGFTVIAHAQNIYRRRKINESIRRPAAVKERRGSCANGSHGDASVLCTQPVGTGLPWKPSENTRE